MQLNPSQFNTVLAYEVSQASRHRRFVTLSILQCSTGVNPLHYLCGFIREGDVLCELMFGRYAVLMADTSRLDAETALVRFQNCLAGKARVQFATASFPQEDLAATDFVSKLATRLAPRIDPVPVHPATAAATVRPEAEAPVRRLRGTPLAASPM